MDNPGKRLAILGSAEIEAIYGRPCFTQEERAELFALSVQEKEVLGQFHSIKSRAFFILQLGYLGHNHPETGRFTHRHQHGTGGVSLD